MPSPDQEAEAVDPQVRYPVGTRRPSCLPRGRVDGEHEWRDTRRRHPDLDRMHDHEPGPGGGDPGDRARNVDRDRRKVDELDDPLHPEKDASLGS